MKKLLDDIHCMFKTEDYVDDKPLSGEFLLGYHCQRSVFKKLKDQNEEEENSTNMDEEDN
jgi:CRISPR-associated protein Csd1